MRRPRIAARGRTVLLLLAMLSPSRYTRGNDLYWVFGWYGLSKLLETFDAQVLALDGVVSGHTLKHIAAAIAGFTVCYMLSHRTLKEPKAAQEPSGSASRVTTERVARGVPPTR